MAVRFDAATDRLSYQGATAPPDPRNGITLTAWVYLSVDRNDFSTFLRLWTSAFSTTGTWITTGTGTTLQYATSSGTNTPGYELPVGGWSRIAVTVNGTACTGYGATATGSIVSTNSSVAGGINPTGFTLGGRDPFDSSEWLNGRLAHVRIWASVLTQSEIVAEWDSSTPVKTSGLWAAYPLSSATDILDASGNGRHLTAGTTSVTTEDGPPIAVTIAGTLAGTLPEFTADLDGTVTTAGTLAGTLPEMSGALAGDVLTVGELAGSLPEFEFAVEGLVGAGGPLDATLPELGLAAVGETVAGGEFGGTLPELTAGMSGDVSTAGPLAATLPELAGALAGDVSTAGELAGELPALDLSALGLAVVPATLAGELPEMAAQIVGGTGVAGVLAGTLPALTAALSGEAALPAAGPFVASLPALVMGSGRDDWPPAVSRPEQVSMFAVSEPEEVQHIAVA